MTAKSFFQQSTSLIQTFGDFVRQYQLSGLVVPDHFCYKCGSSDEYEALRKLTEPEAQYIYQSIAAGRRISVIRLCAPIVTTLGYLNFLELSDQKDDGSQTSGFHHIEVYPIRNTSSAYGVVKTQQLAQRLKHPVKISNGIYPTTISFDELLQRMQSAGGKEVRRPHHTTWDIPVNGFIMRLTQEPLIEKIIRDEIHSS